ncbi:MAG TPA: ADOP family duplicated permease [Thermoanaerobaculia bacterium]|nr:ADOP family duplicated permease [Thermoanaerobaculia bacterium]
MSDGRTIRPGVRRLFHLGVHRDDVAAEETRDEIAIHLAERAAQLEARGMSAEAARAEALRRFGPVEPAQRLLVRAAQSRERRLGWRDRLDALRQDLRYAWRTTAAEPGFAAVVVVVIALGVGANAATFGILDKLVLRGPDHVEMPQQLGRVYATMDVPGRGPFTGSSFGYVCYAALRQRTSAFAGVGAHTRPGEVTLGSADEAEQVLQADATWDLFPTLGVRAVRGRFFGPAEDRPGAAARVVVIGDRLWRQRFGADPGVLGQSIVLDGISYTVIGVAPAGFTGAELRRVDAWLPMSLRGPRVAEDWQTTLYAQWLRIVVRRRPGVSPARASVEATAAIRPLFAGSDDQLATSDVTVRPLGFDGAGEEAMEARVARWLDAVALVVLLIACANVANMLLARAVRRRREVAVRVALGVSGARLVRLLLAQSVVLAVLGGAAALAVVPFASRLLRATLLPDVEWSSMAVDARTFAVALGLTLATGLVTGLTPAVLARRRDLLEALRTGVREGGGRSSSLRTLLTIAQAAFSVVLLVAAGLFLQSLRQAQSVDLGVEPERILMVHARWPRTAAGSAAPGTSTRDRSQAFYTQALARAQTLPWVESAAIAVGTPFNTAFTVELAVPGWPELPRLPGGGPYIQAVTPRYFETVGLRRLRGRDFGPADRAGSAPVAIVNETMAATLWPRRDPLGACLTIGDPATKPPCATVVGVVEDAHRDSLEEPRAMQYYVPLGHEQGFGGSVLLVRPRGVAQAMIEPMQRVMRSVDPGALWVDVATLQESLDPEIRPWRLGATLVGVCGGLALLIAAVGLYSLVAHAVASRAHELSVRVALGAKRRDVFWLVLRRGLGLAAVGLAGGVVLALVVGPRIGDLLFHTSPRDPRVFACVVGALLATAALASLLPARRAMTVDPAAVLRDE